MKLRRGKICEDVVIGGSPLHRVGGTLPVAESFGFVKALQAATAGHAFTSLCFSHWAAVCGDPWAAADPLATLVARIRLRNGLKPDSAPTVDDFRDRL
jgi:translation elongation factor EF-G